MVTMHFLTYFISYHNFIKTEDTYTEENQISSLENY